MDDTVRTGATRIPPGQYVTKKWPVLTFGATPQIVPEDWNLRIHGALASEARLTWADFQALPHLRVMADFHCVTRFSTLDNDWSGFSTRQVFGGVGLRPDASHVMVHCVGGYTTNLPLEDF